MNFVHCVPPVAILLIAAAWLSHLRESKSTLKQDNAMLREKIAYSRNSAVAQNERARARLKNEKDPSASENKPSADWVSTSRDWKELVLLNNNESQYRVTYTAAWARLEKLASEMTGDELARAYSEMTTLPVHAPFRRELDRLMLNELTKKSPEFAFSQYIANYQSEERAPPMGGFDGWLARDPAAATTWYEGQLAAGVFDKSLDGKSPAKLLFESAFIKSLLSSDPAAAEQRMKDISPDLSGSVGGYFWDIPKENGKVFVDLLRKTMPMEEYTALLNNTLLTDFEVRWNDYRNDPQTVEQNLEKLGFTPEERSSLIETAFTSLAQGGLSRDKFDNYRQWIQAIDSSSADRATGAALVSCLGDAKTMEAYDYVEKIANDYHSSGAGDELLIPLIEGSASGKVSFPKDKGSR